MRKIIARWLIGPELNDIAAMLDELGGNLDGTRGELATLDAILNVHRAQLALLNPPTGGFLARLREEIAVTGGHQCGDDDFAGDICALPAGHDGPHDDLADLGPFNELAVDELAEDQATAPRRFELPDGPVTGRVVRAMDGSAWWRRRRDGKYERVEPHDGRWRVIEPDGPHWWSWPGLLAEEGPLEEVPLTDVEIEDERLYGPSHARWGDPYTPCPWGSRVQKPDETWVPVVACALGVEHVGPHQDAIGGYLGVTELDPDLPPPGPDELRASLAEGCSCGRPDRHQPGCPRYRRAAGTAHIGREDPDDLW